MTFLHTADWQLGLKLRFISGEAGARARTWRFDTVRRIAVVARERSAQAVLVAGDVFDDNTVGMDTLQLAEDALAQFDPIPVVLMPGNHDPGSPDTVLGRLRRRRHVHVCLDSTPLVLGSLVVHPCPVQRRHERRDPSSHLERPPQDGKTHVVLAHGGVLDFGENAESTWVIDVDRLLDLGYDYVALGDWHGTFRYRDRAWYPGTPEPTRFKERDPGNVLLVSRAEPGATPTVEPVSVARTRWHTEARTLEGNEDLDVLADWIAQLPEKGSMLLQMKLSGDLNLGESARLDRLLEDLDERLLYLDADRDDIRNRISDEELDELRAEGFVAEAVTRLRDRAEDIDRAALRLLHRYLTEAEL